MTRRTICTTLLGSPSNSSSFLSAIRTPVTTSAAPKM
jgi:hypothetical protein